MFTPHSECYVLHAACREAMVSATIHLANRDWNGLIDDFVALGFLPVGCDRCATAHLTRLALQRLALPYCGPELGECSCILQAASVALLLVLLVQQHRASLLLSDLVICEHHMSTCSLPRGLIIPVMDRVLGPYLRGGGAKAFNFQVRPSPGLLPARAPQLVNHLILLLSVIAGPYTAGMCLRVMPRTMA